MSQNELDSRKKKQAGKITVEEMEKESVGSISSY